MSTTLTASPSAAILFLHAQTGLHPGSGTALGTVDLPVQRERHTQWPLIPGSAIKGVLRDLCRRQAGNDSDLFVVFGPETSEADKHAGALAVTDARILLFPVRSLRGVFAWVTCPAVLQRASRDLALAGLDGTVGTIRSLANRDEVAACPAQSPLLIPGENKFLLEEMEFERVEDFQVPDWLADATADPFSRQRVRTHTAVISDNDFGHFVQHATEIVARIGLDYERKTVKQGALFYQEFLPAETIFYTLVLANASRRDGHTKTAQEVLGYVTGKVSAGSVLQIGGDETIGKGFCTVNWLAKKEP